jgi:3-hydroxybutyryl-CoA dehydrogenase
MRVGVVGCGLMGSGIAEVCARAGLDVVVVETDPDAVTAGRSRLTTSLARAEAKGKIDSADDVLSRIRLGDDLAALGDREFVVEAVAEDERIKTDLFTRLDRIVTDPDAVLASNTSSLPITRLGAVTSRPDRVIGVHFFNPVPVMTLVELVPGLATAERTVDRAREFAEQRLGKVTVRCADRAGFVVNALLIPYLLAAIRMLESGFASAEDIDTGMVRGASHPLGPLALTDLIGLDTTAAIADSLYAEFKDPSYAAPALLRRLVEAGRLGRKSGRGFYPY